MSCRLYWKGHMKASEMQTQRRKCIKQAGAHSPGVLKARSTYEAVAICNHQQGTAAVRQWVCLISPGQPGLPVALQELIEPSGCLGTSRSSPWAQAFCYRGPWDWHWSSSICRSPTLRTNPRESSRAPFPFISSSWLQLFWSRSLAFSWIWNISRYEPVPDSPSFWRADIKVNWKGRNDKQICIMHRWVPHRAHVRWPGSLASWKIISAR